MLTLNLHFHDFMQDICIDFLEYLFDELGIKSKIKQKTIQNDNFLECKFTTNEEITQIIQQLLYHSHPFYKITNEKNEEVFQFNFDEKEYLQYNITKEIEYIPLVNYLMYSTCNYIYDIVDEEEELKFVKIIDPLCEIKTLPIEYMLYLEQSLQRINKKTLINTDIISNQISLLKSEKPSFKTQFTTIMQDQQLFKQLREESIKARVKLKQSQFELDFLDVKFQEEQFHVTTSLILHKSKKEFDELIKEYLYQCEFITSHIITFICEYKDLPKDKLKKYHLEVIDFQELKYKDKIYYFYVIGKE